MSDNAAALWFAAMVLIPLWVVLGLMVWRWK